MTGGKPRLALGPQKEETEEKRKRKGTEEKRYAEEEQEIMEGI